MKKNLLLATLLLFCSTAFGQTTTISGRLLNCKDSILQLLSGTNHFKDTVTINADGTFSYKTQKIKGPFKGSLTNSRQIQIQLFVAPGYQLEINADVKDHTTAKSTLNYEGIGGKVNQYWLANRISPKPDTVNWLIKDEESYIANLKRIRDDHTAINRVFSTANTESYSDYFKQSLLLDKKFAPYLALYTYYANAKKYNWQQIKLMEAKFGGSSLELEFQNEANLASNLFCFLANEYPYYCITYQAFLADSLVQKMGETNYMLTLAKRFYSAKVYDYVAYNHLKSALNLVHKMEDFKALDSYIKKIGDVSTRASIRKIEAEKIKIAQKISAGAESPPFSLADTAGKVFTLNDMKGKVVYIDLWASWCKPCKAETPHLKKLYDLYKDNNKLQIISIASFDAKNRKQRYEIIRKDRMDWLQLEDTDDRFAKSYQANSIPRFIIINKNGKIVDSDAARPSQTELIISILNKEINK